MIANTQNQPTRNMYHEVNYGRADGIPCFLPPMAACISDLDNLPYDTELILPSDPFPRMPLPDAKSPSPGPTSRPFYPGTRCPTCAEQGKEVWVIPGRCCGYCGTECGTPSK